MSAGGRFRWRLRKLRRWEKSGGDTQSWRKLRWGRMSNAKQMRGGTGGDGSNDSSTGGYMERQRRIKCVESPICV